MSVHETFTRNGRAVFQCGFDEKPGARLLEIPQWMVDSVACRRMSLATVPTVSCGALLDLKALLRCASLPDSDVVLRDRDAIYGGDFAGMTRDMGIADVLTAPRSPWQNPFAERLVGSVRRESLDHVIVWNERSLRRTLHNYFAYYKSASYWLTSLCL